MNVKEMKKKIDDLTARLTVIEKERSKLQNDRYKLEQKYYPAVGSKYIGKCYKESDSENIRTSYYKLLKARSVGEFWAEEIMIQRFPEGDGIATYMFALTNYYNPVRRKEISVKEYEQMRTKCLRSMEKGFKVKK